MDSGLESRVVALLSDGTRVKGFSRVFNPLEASFHLKLASADGETGERREIAFADTYAAFFVRDFAFGRTRRYEPEDDLTPMSRPPSVGGRVLRVETMWGETLVGLTYDYREDQPGFFIFPTDPLSRTLNLERAYLLNQAVARVEFAEPRG
ncbi:MAG TPA: hypothetical protein VIE68_03995 [Gemmatimonadota bacterium]|jgi:hypothetical protein